MARSLICFIVVLSLLTLGVESAVELASGEHAHGDDIAQISDSDTLEISDLHDEGHCPNCCHGHAGHINSYFSSGSCKAASPKIDAYQQRFINFYQAPPTPPPNV